MHGQPGGQHERWIAAVAAIARSGRLYRPWIISAGMVFGQRPAADRAIRIPVFVVVREFHFNFLISHFPLGFSTFNFSTNARRYWVSFMFFKFGLFAPLMRFFALPPQ
jgi:hypothetical protein